MSLFGILKSFLEGDEGGEPCRIAEGDVPAGAGGINREGYTYGQLRRRPIVPEVLQGVRNPVLRRWAEECNARCSGGFVMVRRHGEYCFDGLRVGPMVKLPSPAQMRVRLGGRPTAAAIREVSYGLLREEVARLTGLSVGEAAAAIGAQLDCVPHEDVSGYVYMVPNWAHRWFRHRGYVARVLEG